MAGENLFLEFERDNAPLVGMTETVLSGIVRDRPLHARFLNTLAMLEHMGSARIMATQQGPAIDQPTLKHLADESRHAFFFKRQAEHEAGRALAGGAEDLLAAPAARRYFRRLEARILRNLPPAADGRATYLSMSMMVEFRAIWGYRIYQSVLNRAGHALSLKSLLAEESGHLTDMAARLEEIGQFDRARIRTLWQVEQDLYRRLLAALAAPALALIAAPAGAYLIAG